MQIRILVDCRLSNGLKMRVVLGDLVSDQIRKKGCYEPETVRVLREELKTSSTFFDVGANLGQYTLMAAPICREVHCFEATPDTFAMLDYNIHQNNLKNSVANQLAIADMSGEVDIVEARIGNLGASSIRPSQQVSGRIFRVPSISIDEYCERERARPDLIKIDVEGAELLVLRGAGRTLRDHRPLVIIEFCEVNQRQFGFTIKCLEDYLQGCSYDLFRIVENGLEAYKEVEGKGEFNVLAVPRSPRE